MGLLAGKPATCRNHRRGHFVARFLPSLGIFVGLAAVRAIGLAVLDPSAALLIAALILKAAWDITGRSFLDLLDRSQLAISSRH